MLDQVPTMRFVPPSLQLGVVPILKSPVGLFRPAPGFLAALEPRQLNQRARISSRLRFLRRIFAPSPLRLQERMSQAQSSWSALGLGCVRTLHRLAGAMPRIGFVAALGNDPSGGGIGLEPMLFKIPVPHHALHSIPFDIGSDQACSTKSRHQSHAQAAGPMVRKLSAG